MVSVSKEKRVTPRTLAAPKELNITHIFAFVGPYDHGRFTNFHFTEASATVRGKFQGHEHPMFIDSGSEI